MSTVRILGNPLLQNVLILVTAGLVSSLLCTQLYG
jgi:hypothetical protein